MAPTYRQSVDHDDGEQPRRPNRRGRRASFVGDTILAVVAIVAYHFPESAATFWPHAASRPNGAQMELVALFLAIAAGTSLLVDCRVMLRHRLDPRDYRAMVVISLIVNYALAIASVVALAFFVDDLAVAVGRPLALAVVLLSVAASLIVAWSDANVLTHLARIAATQAANNYWTDEIALIDGEIELALDAAGVTTPGFEGLHEMAALARAAKDAGPTEQ